MKFKIRFHLYIHNKCVAFKKHFCCHSRCVCVLSIQNEAAAHHMHCCTDLEKYFLQACFDFSQSLLHYYR